MNCEKGIENRDEGFGNGKALACWRVARGFTILEIMISVLILGLGLLGLGALFPVVIRSQRQGADASFGAMAADAAKATIKTMDYESALMGPYQIPRRELWREWRLDSTGAGPGSGGLNQDRFERGEWLVPNTNATTGETRFGIPGNAMLSFEMPVGQRLYPVGSPNLAPPRFVWDYVVHRVDDGDLLNDSSNDPLEVAVFVRRLDVRIRVAPGRNLYATVADGSLAAADRRLAVGVDVATGLPTNDGTGVYAKPIMVAAQFRYNPPGQTARDRLYFNGATPEEWAMVKQAGQKLVDNLGNMHTVSGSEETGGVRYVMLESPVPSYVTEDSRLQITQVVLTPQIPAAVRVFRIEP